MKIMLYREGKFTLEKSNVRKKKPLKKEKLIKNAHLVTNIVKFYKNLTKK